MRIRFALLAVLAGAPPLAAQGATALYTRWNAVSGFEYQRYHFAKGLGVDNVTSASQWSLPLVIVAPVGRQMSLDLTTHLAHSSVTSATSQSFTGLTDTQLRLLYTLGRDRAVASVSINLPTGKHSFPTSKFVVSSSMSSPFLSFPVSTLGSGFGITGGLAYAVPAGKWNLGLAASMRYASSYEPFSDQSVTYNPGLEGRLRVGADRLVGERGRLLVGMTYSTFSTDEFSGSGIPCAWYNPGARIIGDLGYGYTWGRTTVAFGAWDYYRAAGSSNAACPDAKENVLNAELRVGRQLSPRLVIEPLLSFRQWSPANISGGRLVTVGASARIGISDRVSATVTGRIEPGWVYDPVHADRSNVTGTGLSMYLRYQR